MSGVYVGAALQTLLVVAAVGTFYWAILALWGDNDEHKR